MPDTSIDDFWSIGTEIKQLGPEPLKRCSKCKQHFPPTIEYFSQNPNGIGSACHTCAAKAHRQWTAENPDKVKSINERRKHRQRILPNAFTEADKRRALDYFSGHCAVCGRLPGIGQTLHFDHWIPIADPRPDNPGTVPTNMLPLCGGIDGCNNHKHANDPAAWLRERFGQYETRQILRHIRAYFDSLR